MELKLQIKRFPIATAFLVTLNVVVFALGTLSGLQTQIIQDYGFIPNHLFYESNDQEVEINNLDDSTQQDSLSSLPLQQSRQQSSSPLFYTLATLFTSMFIHANIAHIAFNLFALVYLGGYAERAIGIPRYILVYFMSGIVADFISWCNSVAYLKQWRCSTNRCIGSYFRRFRHSCQFQVIQGPIIGWPYKLYLR